MTPRHHVRWATARLFNRLDTGSAVEAIEAAGKAEEGLFLAANWIDAVSRESNFAQDTAKLFAPARTRFIQLVRETLDGYKTTNPLDIPNHIWALIWEGRSLEKEEAANWMNATVTDNGTWPVIDVIARFVSAQALLGTPNPEWTLDSLDISVVDDLIGLDLVFDSLEAELNSSDQLPPNPRTIQATPPTRRSFALAALKQERARRASIEPNPRSDE